MKETKFKILMYCGIYVDSNLLDKGIYATQKPYLYSKYDTIESLIKYGENIKDMNGNGFISEKYFENLKQCQLVDITLLISE